MGYILLWLLGIPIPASSFDQRVWTRKGSKSRSAAVCWHIGL
jgi:hypothetical protein